MKATEGAIGRVFIIRLEDGDKVPDCIEDFAAEKGVKTAQVTMVGGIGSGEVVVGPRDSAAKQPEAMQLPVDGAHEIVGVGVLAPDQDGKPTLHIHGALGRAGATLTGCLRPGVSTWLVGEVIMLEITGTNSMRIKDATTGFALLEP